MSTLKSILPVWCIACAMAVATSSCPGCAPSERMGNPVAPPKVATTSSAATSPVSAPSPAPDGRASTPVTPGVWRAAMIDEAMTVASSLEAKAHERVKSRLQREVAAVAIDLGMIEAALRYASVIQDWRRAEVTALVAQALARSGESDRAALLVREALEGSAGTDGWMRERLLTEVAVALALLGEVDQARQFAGQVPQELTGRVEAALVPDTSLEDLDRQCAAFDAAIATKAFDVVRSGVDGYLAVWERVPEDGVRVARAERAIRQAAPGLPIDLQIELRIRLADRLLASGRRDDAAEELAQASEQFRTCDFTPDTIGRIARDLARAFLRLGQPGQARRVIQETFARYQADPEDVVDIDRADVLRPLAEALVDTGDHDQALHIWRLALEVGSLNPNARPRAEDLCLTCLSMVRSGVEPPEDLQSTIRSIRSGLKAPW
jgi:tetratricopeptide (TPR) repeat protein